MCSTPPPPAEIERAAWREKIVQFLSEHPTLAVPPDFDAGTMARDLRSAEFEYRDIRLPQEKDRLTDIAAVKFMERLGKAAKAFKAVLKELDEYPGNRRHLAECIDQWAVSHLADKDNPAAADFSVDSIGFLDRTQRAAAILEAQSRVLKDQYENRGKDDGRHSRAFAAVFPDAASARQWLIGERLPKVYLKHFGQRLAINHTFRDGREICIGTGLDFLVMALDHIGVRHPSGTRIPDETLRSIVHAPARR